MAFGLPLRTILGSFLQLDAKNSGPAWKNESGVMAIRDAADLAYARLACGAPNASSEAVPLGSLVGNCIYAPDTYANRPTATDNNKGSVYIPTDLPGTQLQSGGASSGWIVYEGGIKVVAPTVTAGSLTAVNSYANYTVAQLGPFIQVSAANYLWNVFRGWQVGTISKGGSNQWTATIGISGLRSYMAVPFGCIGIYATDDTKYMCWELYMSTAQYGSTSICGHYYSTINASVTTSTTDRVISGPPGDAPLFLRVRFDGTNYNVEGSRDGSTWLTRYSGTAFITGLSATFTPTKFGFVIDNFDQYGSSNPTSCYPGTARICQLSQTATA